MKYEKVYLKFTSKLEFENKCKDAEGVLLPWFNFTDPLEHTVLIKTNELGEEEVSPDFHTGGWVKEADKGYLSLLESNRVYPETPQIIL